MFVELLIKVDELVEVVDEEVELSELLPELTLMLNELLLELLALPWELIDTWAWLPPGLVTVRWVEPFCGTGISWPLTVTCVLPFTLVTLVDTLLDCA